METTEPGSDADYAAVARAMGFKVERVNERIRVLWMTVGMGGIGDTIDQAILHLLRGLLGATLRDLMIKHLQQHDESEHA